MDRIIAYPLSPLEANRPVQLAMRLRHRQRCRRCLKRHLKIPAKTSIKNRDEKRSPLDVNNSDLGLPPEAWGVLKDTTMTSGPEPRSQDQETRRWRQRHGTLPAPMGPQSRGALELEIHGFL